MNRLDKKMSRTSVLKRVEEVAQIELRQKIYEIQQGINEVENRISYLKSDRESLNEFLIGYTTEGQFFDPYSYMNTQKKIDEFDEQITQTFNVLSEFKEKSEKLHDDLKLNVSRIKSLQRLGEKLSNSKKHLLNEKQNKVFDDMAVLKHSRGS